jgi:hypothetical protein
MACHSQACIWNEIFEGHTVPMYVTIYFSPVQEASLNTREASCADERATVVMVQL